MCYKTECCYYFLGLMSTRYLLAILLSVGLGIVYGLKVNLHVAIVSMVNHTHIKTLGGGDHGHGNASGSEICPAEGGETNGTEVAEVNSKILCFLLCFFYFWYVSLTLWSNISTYVYRLI